MIVAIAGASGLTGGLCLQQLLLHPAVTSVIAIGRSPLPLVDAKLQSIQLIDEHLPAPVVAHAFISCLGTTIKKAGSKAAFEAADRHLPVYLARQLQQQGCQTAAVVSSMGAAINSPIFYSRVKGAMEADMQQLGLSSLYLLRPSIIDGQRQESRPLEKAAIRFTKFCHPLMVGRLRAYRAIKAAAIATVLVKSVTHPTPGTHIFLSDIIEALAAPNH